MKKDFSDDSILEKYVEKAKKSIFEADVEGLEEHALEFKGRLITWTRAMQKAYDEEIIKAEKLWDAWQDRRKSIISKIDEVKNDLHPLAEKITEVKNLFEDINSFSYERLVSLIHTVSTLTDKEKELFKFALENK